MMPRDRDAEPIRRWIAPLEGYLPLKPTLLFLGYLSLVRHAVSKKDQIPAATAQSPTRAIMSQLIYAAADASVAPLGVSISQLERALRVRFGHDQHISGDLVKTG